MRISRSALTFVLGVVSFGAAPAVQAGTITYTYAGDAFTGYNGSDNSSAETNISVSITLTSALGIDFCCSVTPLSFEISDGSTTLTDQSPDIDYGADSTAFAFRTDSAGDITAWTIFVFQTVGSCSSGVCPYLELITETVGAVGSGEGTDGSYNCGGVSSTPNENGVCNSTPGGSAGVSYSDDLPGWSQSSSTPEPSSVVLMIVGGLVALIGKGFRVATARSNRGTPIGAARP